MGVYQYIAEKKAGLKAGLMKFREEQEKREEQKLKRLESKATRTEKKAKAYGRLQVAKERLQKSRGSLFGGTFGGGPFGGGGAVFGGSGSTSPFELSGTLGGGKFGGGGVQERMKKRKKGFQSFDAISRREYGAPLKEVTKAQQRKVLAKAYRMYTKK